MLQYIYQKFDFGGQLRFDQAKYQTLSLNI